MFKSLDEIKKIAEKFSARKIVPQRVLYIEGKGRKKAKSDLVFTRNAYRLLSKDNHHVFVIDFNEIDDISMDYFMKLKGNHKNLNLNCAKYGKKGNLFIGNSGLNESDFIFNINKAVSCLNIYMDGNHD